MTSHPFSGVLGNVVEPKCTETVLRATCSGVGSTGNNCSTGAVSSRVLLARHKTLGKMAAAVASTFTADEVRGQ